MLPAATLIREHFLATARCYLLELSGAAEHGQPLAWGTCVAGESNCGAVAATRNSAE